MSNLIPLGMRLATSIKDKNTNIIQQLFEDMIYDPKEGINKIKDGEVWIPAVSSKSNLGTETFTKVHQENTDHDHSVLSMGTRTITEVRAENTDTDYNQSTISLSTRTNTYFEIEGTDTD